jgi:putative phosphoserine phosphatase/1-acylglycerol-3-phosphate O-acyltransferase
VVRAATVEVVVMPPIPTDDWTLENLNDRIAEVHARYRKILSDD